MEKWKIEHNIRCYEIATLMMKYEFDTKRVDEILSRVYREPIENRNESGIIEERYNDGSHYTKDEHGRFTGSTGSGGGSGGGSSGKGNKRLEDIQIGRSVGAKAKNHDVMNLQTGEKFHFVEGTRIQDVEVFAGKGVKTPYRNAWKYARDFGGKEKDWQHVKGKGVLDYYGEDRRAEVHWSQCAGIGKVDFFIKRWLE